MASGLTRRSAIGLCFGALLWVACGGKSALGSDEDDSRGGNGSGRGGAPGQGGQVSITAHLSECESICTKATAAGCSAGDAPCVMTCATVTSFPNCQAAIQSWLTCAKTSEVMCDASGNPSFPACEAQLALAGACAVATPPDQPVAESCSGYCSQIEAAGCRLTTPMGECRQACGLAGTVLSSCQESYLAWLNCAKDSGAACQPNGELNTSVCSAQQLVWLGCASTVLGTAGLGMTGTAGAPAWPMPIL